MAAYTTKDNPKMPKRRRRRDPDDQPAQPVPPMQAAQPVPAILSSLSPGDLGLKAGFWTRNEADPVTFRPIVGWLVVTNFALCNIGPFIPVVLSDMAYPTLVIAQVFPTFIGVFSVALTPEEARAKFATWDPSTVGVGGLQSLSYDGGQTLTMAMPKKPASRGNK